MTDKAAASFGTGAWRRGAAQHATELPSYLVCIRRTDIRFVENGQRVDTATGMTVNPALPQMAGAAQYLNEGRQL